MAKKSPRVCIREIDRKFFRYLYSSKVALTSQINRDVFQYPNLKALYFRLGQFTKKAWIKSQYHPYRRAEKFYTLTRKGYRKFILGCDESRVELGSSSVEHDLNLIDIHRLLTQSDKIKKIWSENTLQSLPASQRKQELNPYIEMRSDGAVLLKLKSGSVMMALEYESLQKERGRYKSLVKRYYQNDEIPSVFYVCESHSIEKLVQSYEALLFKDQTPKFFYRVLSDLKLDENLTFYNRRQEKLDLMFKSPSVGGSTRT